MSSVIKSAIDFMDARVGAPKPSQWSVIFTNGSKLTGTLDSLSDDNFMLDAGADGIYFFSASQAVYLTPLI